LRARGSRRCHEPRREQSRLPEPLEEGAKPPSSTWYDVRVFTLRCTAKLLRRLRAAPVAEPVAPTTTLGDWYANLLYERGGQVVLFVNERSLLPVLVSARDGSTLLPRLREAAREVLTRLGAPAAAVEAEVAAMAEARIARTASRQVLGSMTDFAWMLTADRGEGRSLIERSIHLAHAPCGPIGMRSPEDVAPELLRGALPPHLRAAR
jgi:hypothetical protein